MNVTSMCLMALLAAVVTLAAYMSRVYSEFGKILSREVQDNLDAWELYVEPRLWMSRERASLTASVLMHLAMGLLALELGAVVFDRAPLLAKPSLEEVFQAVLGVILVAAFCTQVFPFLLFQRTRGLWVVRLLWPVRLLLYLAFPVTLLISFLLSVAALAEEPVTAEEEAAGDVEALLEAGEEEGILEESDRALVRSAVEFGDKLVRDVMTPRPQIFAVPESMPLEEFLDALRVHDYSRVPVYQESLDAPTGIAFAHDLLQISDHEARTRTVASIRRPIAVVPETKKGYELLREMQHEKQHMRVVIDEYGQVAGLVTIEDLLEEIVGSIADEHEDDEDTRIEGPQPEEDGAWLVPGGFPVGRLDELAGPEWLEEEEDGWESQTVGGLVSEAAGRIPLAGEVVEIGTLRMEVVASSDRRVERVRVRLMHPENVPGAQAAAEELEDESTEPVESGGDSGTTDSVATTSVAATAVAKTSVTATGVAKMEQTREPEVE